MEMYKNFSNAIILKPSYQKKKGNSLPNSWLFIYTEDLLQKPVENTRTTE